MPTTSADRFRHQHRARRTSLEKAVDVAIAKHRRDKANPKALAASRKLREAQKLMDQVAAELRAEEGPTSPTAGNLGQIAAQCEYVIEAICNPRGMYAAVRTTS